MGTDINFNKSLGRTYGTRIGLPAFDPAAQAYFAATGITGVTQQAAIDNLVKGLKADGIWSKMKAVYPFVTDNRNLMSYTEDFGNGVWIKSGATVTANNILAPDGTMTADRVVFGAANNYIYQQTTSYGTTANKSIYIKGTAGQTISLDDTWVLSPANLITLTGDWQRVTFTSTTTAGQGQGLAIGTLQSATARTIWVWGAQLELGSTATAYQPIATTQQAFISSQFKYNLVNPVDSDAAFRLVFNGGWTHSSNGATPNGTNGYADTKLTASANLSLTNTHLSFYSRTNSADANSRVDMGRGAGVAGSYMNLFTKLDSTTNAIGSTFGSKDLSSVNSNSACYAISSAISSTSFKLYKNGTIVDTNTSASSGSIASTSQIYIGSQGNVLGPSEYSNRQCAFSSIGDGLLDSEATALYNRVQNFQLALNRAV